MCHIVDYRGFAALEPWPPCWRTVRRESSDFGGRIVHVAFLQYVVFSQHRMFAERNTSLRSFRHAIDNTKLYCAHAPSGIPGLELSGRRGNPAILPAEIDLE